MNTIRIIAEIGSSPAPEWNFDAWCDAAYRAGATHIKAQLFQSEHFLAAEQASKRPLVFPRQRFEEFVNTAHAYGLLAGASVFDKDAVDLVVQFADFVKLAAREQDNTDLRGYTFSSCMVKTRQVFRSVSAFEFTRLGTFTGFGTTLFAIQKYPAGMVESLVALERWARFAKSDGLSFGWSSHTRGDLDCRLAARLGASVIEKHLCLTGDDLEAGHALNPDQFKVMTVAIKGAR